MTLDDLKQSFVGKAADPEVFEVEKGSVKRYAIAVDDLNPLYLDEESAGRSIYGSTVAPPGFFGWPVKQPAPRLPAMVADIIDALSSAGFPNILDGGTEFEFWSPVRAGDTLVCMRRIADLSGRDGSQGIKMAFVSVENNFVNQNGRQVARMVQTLIALQPPKPK